MQLEMCGRRNGHVSPDSRVIGNGYRVPGPSPVAIAKKDP